MPRPGSKLIPHPAHAGGAAGSLGGTLPAVATATVIALLGVQFPLPAGWMASWRGVLDLAASLWLAAFAVCLPACWLTYALWIRRAAPGLPRSPGSPRAGESPARAVPASPGARATVAWLALLLAICAAELVLHGSERNPFVATSRPTAGVETWTTADGYAMLLDGHVAQADGAFLLPMLELFLGDKPPEPSEFDRRAGHVFLVALLARPLGAYWAFATVNLLSWWAASVAVWRLGRRRWPDSTAPWIAALLTATGQGFIFMGTAPQAHAAAFAAFAALLVLADALDVWRPAARLGAWARVGWAGGAAGLIYLVHLPALLVLWLYGFGRSRLAGLVLATALALGIVVSWEQFGARLLGLRFSGGNNDLAGEALGGWLRLASQSPAHLVGQLHASSLRGLLVGAFWYPWWILAFAGWLASQSDGRRWALAVVVAATLPAIAFTTRFNLPRVAYFMYPAIYLLAAAGIDRIGRFAPDRAPRWLLRTALTLGLVVLTNADLAGLQQLDLWFHYSQGNAWW